MVETQRRRIRVVEFDDDEPWQVFPDMAGTGKAVSVPQSITIEIEGLPWRTTARLVRQRDRFAVDQVTIERTGRDPLPAKAHRDFTMDDVAIAIREVARVGRITNADEAFDGGAKFEPVEGRRINNAAADLLARGRTKSQEHVRIMRKRAIWEYRKARKEGDWPDIYAEVAKRLSVSRATAHRYLKDSGEIDRWRRGR